MTSAGMELMPPLSAFPPSNTNRPHQNSSDFSLLIKKLEIIWKPTNIFDKKKLC